MESKQLISYKRAAKKLIRFLSAKIKTSKNNEEGAPPEAVLANKISPLSYLLNLKKSHKDLKRELENAPLDIPRKELGDYFSYLFDLIISQDWILCNLDEYSYLTFETDDPSQTRYSNDSFKVLEDINIFSYKIPNSLLNDVTELASKAGAANQGCFISNIIDDKIDELYNKLVGLGLIERNKPQLFRKSITGQPFLGTIKWHSKNTCAQFFILLKDSKVKGNCLKKKGKKQVVNWELIAIVYPYTEVDEMKITNHDLSGASPKSSLSIKDFEDYFSKQPAFQPVLK